MLSSWQIAQIHTQQGQAFGAQQAYSQQISSRMPAPYQGVGLGAQGFSGGFGQGGGGFNYGGGVGNSYGPGNSFGNRMTSAIGGIGHAAGAGMGIAGAIGGGMMGGVGGAMMGFNVGGIIGGGVKHIANSMMEGAQEQSAIERTLSQFQFQNASSRTGRGFTRNDSAQIGNMVRSMERMPEMLTSFGELNRMMDKMGQMGLMQGVRDAGEFMRKFRDTTATLKDMAKMMGTSMEGALQAFGEARQSGFYSKGDITRNVLNRQVTASVTGMSQAQVGGLQMYGADMAHSLGGSRAGGAKNMLRTMGQLGMANQMGILSNDQIMEMTGKEGSEGIQDLSAQMGQLSYKMGKSNVGQALTLALGSQKDGRYTGEMDQELVEKVRRGELSLSELKSMARSKAGSRGAKLSFAAHRGRLQTEMAGAVGSEGVAMQLQEILGEKGWQNPDAQNLVMQRFGASEEQANLLQKMMPNLQSIGSQMNLANRDEGRRSAINAVTQEHGWDAIKHRIGKKISHYTTDWAKDLGVGVRDYFSRWADDFLDDLSGQYRTTVTKRVADAVIAGGSGLARIQASAQGAIKGLGGGDFSIGSSGGLSGFLAQGAHWMSGDESKGERLSNVMRASGMGGRLSSISSGGGILDQANQYQKLSGNKSLMNLGGGDFVSQQGIDAASAHISSLGGAGGDAALKTLQSKISKEDFAALKASYENAIVGSGASQESDPKKRAEMLTAHMTGYGGRDVSANDLITGKVSVEDFNKQLNNQGDAASRFMRAARKSGLKGNEILAALDASTGRKYRGSVDFGQLAKGSTGGFDGTQKSASDRIKAIEREMTGTFKGGEGVAGWSEIKKYLDQGGDMANLLAGSGGKGGLMRDDDLQKLMKMDPSRWTSADKKKLEDLGVDPVKLATKLNTPEGRAEIDRLAMAADKGKGSAGSIEEYMGLQAFTGLTGISDKFHQRGEAASARLASADTKEARTRLGKTDQGRKMLGLLTQNAALASGYNAAKGLTGDNTADVVAAMRGLKGQDLEDARRAAGTEVTSTYDFDKATRSKLGRGGQSAQGIIDLISGGKGVDDDLRHQIEGMTGKGGKLGGDKIDELMKVLDARQSKGLTATAGTDLKTSQASEQEVSSSLKSLAENTKTLAQIVAQIATKTGTDIDAPEGKK